MTTRRVFVMSAAAAAGGLVVGYVLWPSGLLAHIDRADAGPGERFLASGIKVADNDVVTVVVPHCDMGTGIFTALAQMAAEELDADWTKVRVETAPADRLFANGALLEGFLLDQGHYTRASLPTFLQGVAADATRAIAGFGEVQTTGGSSAVRMTGMYGMRVAGAAAREMLVKAAAARLHVGLTGFRTETSRVIHTASGRAFTYGELAAAAAAYTPSTHPAFKDRAAYRLVGQRIPRLDIPAKVNGGTEYGLDVTLPGMLYAAIRIAPVFGGTLISVDDAMVTLRPGVRKVVRLGDAVAVVADRFWRARSAVDALSPVFDSGGNDVVSSETIRDRHIAVLRGGPIERDRSTGTGARALDTGPVVEATYHVPFLAHAAMEPVNATALYKSDGTLEVWAGTQDGLGARAFCAKTARIGLDEVTFHLLPIGGAFGRRLPRSWNFLEYAVKTAMAVPGTPVKLVFTREQDMQHDYYRPTVTSRFRAVLDDAGMPRAWVNDYTTHDRANPEAHIMYAVPNQEYGTAKVATHVPIGPWRSVASSWHGFFVESFVDELAHRANRDPLEYRRMLLRGKARHLATLDLAAQQAGWGTALPPGQARGIAIVESFGTIAAHVALVEATGTGAVAVRRITSAVDCGVAVNPGGLEAQIEGAIIFGLSAAIGGEITIARGAVVQRNFPDFPVVRLADCPMIDVHIRESAGSLGGGGEPGTPPVAPAVTNAIFAATGVRIRDLPIAKHAVTGAPQPV